MLLKRPGSTYMLIIPIILIILHNPNKTDDAQLNILNNIDPPGHVHNLSLITMAMLIRIMMMMMLTTMPWQ